MKRVGLATLGLASLGALVLSLAACGHREGDAAARPDAGGATRAPRQVHVTAAREISAATGDDVVGTVRSRSVAEISPSVMGTIRALRLALGAQVRAGDVLATLSAGEIEAQASSARAVFEQARLELSRAEQLKTSQSMSPAAYDSSLAQFRVAEAALAEADVMRGYTIIRAPFAGVITQKHADVGDLAVPGKPILVLESPGALRLEAAVPEGVAGHLKVGDTAAVRVDALGREVTGTIAEVSPSADPLSRTLLVKLDLPAEPELRAGMFGRMAVRTGQESAVVVPAAAILRRGQMELAFVVRDQKAQLRIVRAGRTVAGETRVLAGLSAGEQVVTGDPAMLRDGDPVEVTPVKVMPAEVLP